MPGEPEVGLNGWGTEEPWVWWRKDQLLPGNQAPETVTMISWSSLPISEQGTEANHCQITEGRGRNAEEGNHSYAKPKEEEGREVVLSKSASVS